MILLTFVVCGFFYIFGFMFGVSYQKKAQAEEFQNAMKHNKVWKQK